MKIKCNNYSLKIGVRIISTISVLRPYLISIFLDTI